MPSAASHARRDAERLASLTFFLDYQIGRYVVADALRAAGAQVQVHIDHFVQSAPDVEWIPEVGRRNWVFIYRRHEAGIIADYQKLKGTRREKKLSEIALEKCGFYFPDYARYEYPLNLREAKDIAKALRGCVQLGLGCWLITLAVQHLRAAEMGLRALTETILAPLWVVIGVGEAPATRHWPVAC